MPGHKRQKDLKWIKEFPNPYTIDITEIEGFDNLHHPRGILKESMEWAAQIYGADKTYYLVNGSTCGILSAISATTVCGDKLLMSRNCHKSAYYGAMIRQLKTSYIYPQVLKNWGINGGISAEDIEKSWEENPDAKAVILVSPTYEGVVSDIEKIAQVVHEKGIPLIVDEAHGAHFSFGSAFPSSALDCGADIVIQSLHKVLPSFTQTALLHVKQKYVDVEKLERYLQIYQSSSPSYVFMAGMEACIKEMAEKGEHHLKQFSSRLDKYRKRLSSMNHLKLLDDSLKGNCGIHELDRSKIVVSCRNTSLTGKDLNRLLRENYHLEMEMCGADYVTAITTFLDEPQGWERLIEAFEKIDGEISEEKKEVCSWECRPLIRTTLSQAMDDHKEQIPITACAGRISTEFIYLYPPGIPIVAPGEQITRQIVEQVLYYRHMGLPVQGMADTRAECLRVLRHTGASHG